MATTTVPPYDEPIVRTAQEIRDLAHEVLVSMQGDCDKAGDIEDANYYQGGVDALEYLLDYMTGQLEHAPPPTEPPVWIDLATGEPRS